MAWVMLWSFSYVIYQVEFESETLCEAAKAELVADHGIDPGQIACVRVSE